MAATWPGLLGNKEINHLQVLLLLLVSVYLNRTVHVKLLQHSGGAKMRKIVQKSTVLEFFRIECAGGRAKDRLRRLDV